MSGANDRLGRRNGAKRTPRAERPALITGGAGFIGTNVARRLLDEGRPVMIFDNLSRPGVEQNLRWLRERYGAAVARRDRGCPGSRWRCGVPCRMPAQVFHFAAQVAVTTSLLDPLHDFEVNARGTLNLLDALQALDDPPPLLFTSTNKVYGALGDVLLRREAGRYRPVDAAIGDVWHRGDAAAGLSQSVRLLEGGGRPVRAGLRAHFRPAGCRVPHELHLRSAPVRHRGSGLGGAFR